MLYTFTNTARVYSAEREGSGVLGAVPASPTYHFRRGLGVLCSHVLLQGDLRVAHPATVGTREGLRLLHRESFSSIVQV